jgi:hypothetical protein
VGGTTSISTILLVNLEIRGFPHIYVPILLEKDTIKTTIENSNWKNPKVAK